MAVSVDMEELCTVCESRPLSLAEALKRTPRARHFDLGPRQRALWIPATRD